MRIKMLLMLLASGLLISAAWFVQVSGPAQADDVPEKYRETVRKGLEFLVKNQHKDGHWEGDNGKHPVAMTGLVGLALLMEQEMRYGRGLGLGETITSVKYSANVREAADWVIAKADARRDGLVFSEHASETDRYMQGHGLATLFLAGVYVHEGDQARRGRLANVLGRAVKYITSAQSSQGGWYRTSKAEGHDFDEVSSTAIQIQALEAVQHAGISVPSEALHDGKEYLKAAIRKHEERAGTGPNRSRQTDTAAALICLFNEEDNRNNTGRVAKHEFAENWFEYCRREIPVGRAVEFGRDDLTHYWYAQVMFDRGGETWTKYRTAMFDHLQTSQNKDGGWPASEGIGVGRVYSAALWCTALQLDKSSHPSRRHTPLALL